jgi:hypothetical protein
MSTLLSHSNGTTLYVKGASEVVLKECVSEMTEDGKVWLLFIEM